MQPAEGASSGSILTRWDPRIKAAVLMLTLLAVVLMNRVFTLLLAVGLVLALVFWARISSAVVKKRLAWVAFFSGFLIIAYPLITPGTEMFRLTAGPLAIAATREGLVRGLVFSLRLLGAVLIMIVLTGTTPTVHLLRAFQDLRVPPVLLRLSEFTLRFFFISAGELERMRQAQRSRGFKPGKNLFNLHTTNTLGQTVGMLFLRSLARGEQIYTAMLSRGFTGEVKVLNEFQMEAADVWLGFSITAIAVVVFLLDKGVI